MNMDVVPVMMPDQQMMQGSPASPPLPEQLQTQLNSLSEEEKNEAKQALMQIIQILQQMVSQGASEQEIQAFLQQVGLTMEELQQAREMFGI